MSSPAALSYDCFYHIFNRGNNREDIFPDDQNYPFFLNLYTEYISPIAETYAYCLLRNHFHFLVRIKSEVEIQDIFSSQPRKIATPSQQFANLFNAYTKAFNQLYKRSGSLFQKPFQRVAVRSNTHLLQLVKYIHFNPQKHGFVDDYRKWTYSSYHALIAVAPTRLKRETALSWFDGLAGFLDAHDKPVDLRSIQQLALEE